MIPCIEKIKSNENIVAKITLKIVIKAKKLINLNDCNYFIIYIWGSFLQLCSHQD